MKVKILNIPTSGLRLEGITLTQLEFCKRFDKSKIDVIMAAVNNDSEQAIEEFEKIGTKVIKFPSRKKELSKYIIALYKNIKKEKYDVIHVHGSSSILSIELLIAKLAGVKVRIVHSRNTTCDSLKVHKLLKPLFNKSYTHAFACGQDAGEWLFDDNNFTIMHNGKDFSRFNFSNELRLQARKELNLKDNIVLGHVGRISYQKNPLYLIEIFSYFNIKYPNSILYLMGNGRLKAEVESLTERLGVKDKVIFAGSVSDVDFRLQAMDIMVFPSLHEGLPNVVLEWQAEGLPCLISDKITKECAPSDLVEYMSIELPPEKWSNKISQMIEQKRDRELDGKIATERLREENFDIEINAKKMQEMYVNFVNEAKRKK